MKIALDAMNGDYAPSNEVKGAVLAARIFSVRIALIGKPNRIRTELSYSGSISGDISRAIARSGL